MEKYKFVYEKLNELLRKNMTLDEMVDLYLNDDSDYGSCPMIICNALEGSDEYNTDKEIQMIVALVDVLCNYQRDEIDCLKCLKTFLSYKLCTEPINDNSNTNMIK